MKRVIVTGASGFIGKATARKLLETGCVVYGVGRSADRLRELMVYSQFIPILIDSSSPHFLDKIADEEIDTLYHFAWEGGFTQEALKEYSLQISNIQMSCDVMEQAVALGVKNFIYAGTINEVEIHQCLNQYDDFRMRPTCIYASAKLAAELICKTKAQEHHIRFCSGLIPMLLGAGNRSKQVVNIVIEQLLNQEPTRLIEGNNLYDIVYVEDVANAFIAIGDKGKDGMAYYIGHRELKKFKAWMEEIRDCVSPGTPLGFGEYQDPLNLDYSLIDLEALHRDTGFDCSRDFTNNLRAYVDWIKAKKGED